MNDGKFMRELCCCPCFITALGIMGCCCLRQNTLVSVVGCLLAEALNWFSRTVLLTDFRVQRITSYICHGKTVRSIWSIKYLTRYIFGS